MAEDSNAEDGLASVPLTIAGIGASAGGVKALQDFFSALPAKTGAALVLVLHLDPDHQSELAQVIAARTKMPVQQVQATTALEPDHVYVIPPNRQLIVTDSSVSAKEFDEPRGQRAPIDQFFRSLAQHGDGFAIILSGAGSDGALGVRAVKEAGGIILVQDPNEAEYGSMPRAAISAGHADFVLPARELARQFAELVRGKKSARRSEAAETEDLLGRILAYLRLRTGHDFSQYQKASLMRRLERRVQVVKVQNLVDYLNYLREHPEEIQALFADLLISVTRFFRDAPSFERLESIAVPAILDRKGRDEPIRIWVPGCATGEEAYSIAVLFLDEMAKREGRSEIQMFATDLDAKALAVAREGCYPETLSADVSEERLRKYFQKEGGDYRVKREVRDLIVFAQHSVLKDPPFSRLELISCRNFFIYINREMQHKVINTFHYALLPQGYLFLGSSETADHPQGLFRTVDRTARIFQSVGRRNADPLPLPQLPADLRGRGSPVIASDERIRTADPPQQHRQSLLEFGPPSVLVDDSYRVLNFSERSGDYLLHPPGMPTLEITELVRPELTSELRMLLNRAFQLGESGISLPIPVQFNGQSRYVCLQVSPFRGQAALPRALVLFIEGGPAQMPVETGTLPEGAGSDTIQRLQEELQVTRANLRLSRQQFETATENLRASNEELQSINEEYRSTAEELETSREELQSVNEELQTLNSELKSKLDAVSQTNNDLENLMAVTDLGTLFLDRNLRIKRLTPRVRELFSITAIDEGRLIGDFSNQLDYPEFEYDARLVMQQEKIVEKTVRGDGRWHLMQMRPYRTTEGAIDGVVVTFVDTATPRNGKAAVTTKSARAARKRSEGRGVRSERTKEMREEE